MSHLVLVLGIVLAFAPLAWVQAQDAQLSEVDQLRVRLHQTEIALEQALASASSCRAQLRSVQLTEEQAAMKADIEARYPGFTFDPATGQLVKRPEP